MEGEKYDVLEKVVFWTLENFKLVLVPPETGICFNESTLHRGFGLTFFRPYIFQVLKELFFLLQSQKNTHSDTVYTALLGR